MSSLTARLTDAKAMKFINQVGDVFKNAPALPTGLVEFLVKVAPYLALIGAILTLVAGPIVLVLGSIATVLALNPVYMIATLGSVVIALVQAVLMLMAFKPLQQRQMTGWIFLFWSEVLAAVSAILSLVGSSAGAVIWSLIWVAIWFYVIFQMRSFYK